jgi:3-oxoacyl-[acyl-carrier-protein] synthase II
VVHGLGQTVDAFWAAVVAGRNGIDRVALFDPTGYSSQIGAEVRGWDPDAHMDPKEVRRNDRYTHFGFVAAKEAFRDAGLDLAREDPDRVGVIIGSGIGGMATFETQHKRLMEGGPRKVSPFTIPALIGNMCSGLVAIETGARGPNFGLVSACATATHALGEAMHMIRRGDADAMIAGGAEAAITPFAYASFCSMKAMSTRNDDPATACRPFSLGRDGFIMGEGAGVLVIESLRPRPRPGRPHLLRTRRLRGHGRCPSHHPAGSRGQGALHGDAPGAGQRGVRPEQVDYINAHGTSTPYNDKFETLAIKRVFGDHARRLAVSSTKSMTGHLLGAAGGIESVISVKTLQTGTIAPTINLHEPDPECDLDYVPNVARSAPVSTVLSNNLGFGGQNAAIVFRSLT